MTVATVTEDLEVTSTELLSVKSHASHRRILMVATTLGDNAVESEVASLSTTGAFFAKYCQNFSALFARPNYLTAYLSFAHAAKTAPALKVSQPQNFLENSGVES